MTHWSLQICPYSKWLQNTPNGTNPIRLDFPLRNAYLCLIANCILLLWVARSTRQLSKFTPCVWVGIPVWMAPMPIPIQKISFTAINCLWTLIHLTASSWCFLFVKSNLVTKSTLPFPPVPIAYGHANCQHRIHRQRSLLHRCYVDCLIVINTYMNILCGPMRS